MSTSITISKQIAIKDEGVLKTSDVNSIDFTGAGITATNVGNAVTVNVPGGVSSVSATTPVVATGTTTPVISLASSYGDTQNPYASKTANNILAAPNGTAGVPTFRAIVSADIPTLNQNTTGTASNVTGIVAVANGGTGTATPSLVAGTNITVTGTFPNQTINSSGGGGGGATCLQTMVFTNSLFGFRTSNAMSASYTTNHTISSAGMNYTPYIPNETFTCVEFSINVSTAIATGLGRICVYSSINNVPTNLLYSSVDLDCSTTGTKSVISSFVFTQGTTYWLAIQTNVNNINVTGLNGDSSIPLCHFSTGLALSCWVQVSLTFASGAPSVAGVNSFLLNTSPQILMKK